MSYKGPWDHFGKVLACRFYVQKGSNLQKRNLKPPEPREGKESENWLPDFKMQFLKKRLSKLAETLNMVSSMQDQPMYTHQTL